jgi:hypothetical protein
MKVNQKLVLTKDNRVRYTPEQLEKIKAFYKSRPVGSRMSATCEKFGLTTHQVKRIVIISPEYKKMVAIANQKSYQKHKEHYNEINRSWYAKNKKYAAERYAKWSKEHPAEYEALKAVYRARYHRNKKLKEKNNG